MFWRSKKPSRENRYVLTDKEIYRGKSPAGFLITRAERTRVRPFYDSWWLITTTSGQAVVTRYDDETAESFSELSSCRSLDDVKALCLRDRIYYD